jgi:uncharacterized protein DUF3891
MIIRADNDSLLFITQPDHARLAAEAISHWRDGGFEDNPRRRSILLAAREHDNGWREEDATTHVDGDGKPLDFICVPIDVRQRIWPRAVDRLAGEDSYAAALVAQHALSIYSQFEADLAWGSFFETMTTRRSALLETSGDAAPHIGNDYAFVNAADRMSLAFCTGWTQPLESFGRRIILKRNTVEVSPDPFAGARVPLRIIARRLPQRGYASAADLRAALDQAPVEVLEGEAAGTAA